MKKPLVNTFKSDVFPVMSISALCCDPYVYVTHHKHRHHIPRPSSEPSTIETDELELVIESHFQALQYRENRRIRLADVGAMNV